jgi:hypothetical protein
MTCGAEACKLGAMIQGVELRVHFLKSFQKGSTCENLLQKGLKSEKVGPTDKQILTPFLEVSCSTCWSFFTWPHQEFKKHMNSRYTFFSRIAHYRFVWLISHYPTVLFFLNKPATSNQATILFSENKSALATYEGLSTRQIWIFSKSQLACCC